MSIWALSLPRADRRDLPANLPLGAQPAGGQQLEVVQIRIGGPREEDVANATLGDLRRVRRALAVYISDRDLQQLFVKSIETPDIRDEEGYPVPDLLWDFRQYPRLLGHSQCPQDHWLCPGG